MLISMVENPNYTVLCGRVNVDFAKEVQKAAKKVGLTTSKFVVQAVREKMGEA